MRTIASKDITVQDFKDHFTRDFKYASGHLLECQSEYVTDADITKSFNEALVNFNDTLFSDDAITLIHNAARGYPRAVNNLAVHALTAAFAAKAAIVDEKAARIAVTESGHD